MNNQLILDLIALHKAGKMTDEQLDAAIRAIVAKMI